MTEATQARGKWQLSLANILVFVFAVATWLALMISGSGVFVLIGLGMIYIGLFAVISARAQRRYALLLLMVCFELIATGSTFFMLRNHMRTNVDRRRRYQILHSIANGMDLYYSDWNQYPPPPIDSKLCGAELTRYLSLPGKNAPFLRYGNELAGQSSAMNLSGGNGYALKWELQGKDVFILIDVGKDGVAGKYSVEESSIKKIPNDTNHDQIDDGADDEVVTRTRGGNQ